MTNILFTTVGESLITASTCWRNLENFTEQLIDVDERRESFKKYFLSADWQRTTLDNFCANSWNRSHVAELPAELASLYTIVNARNDRLPLTAADKIVLLPTKDVYVDRIAEMLEFLIENVPVVRKSLPAKISVRSLGHVDPAHPLDFQTGLKDFWDEEIKPENGQSKIYFNLTGGFKGTLTYFVMQATMAVASGDNRFGGFFYLFEESDKVVRFSIPDRPQQVPSDGPQMVTWEPYIMALGIDE